MKLKPALKLMKFSSYVDNLLSTINTKLNLNNKRIATATNTFILIYT